MQNSPLSPIFRLVLSFCQFIEIIFIFYNYKTPVLSVKTSTLNLTASSIFSRISIGSFLFTIFSYVKLSCYTIKSIHFLILTNSLQTSLNI